MGRPLVIVHGWSDAAGGMEALADRLGGMLDVDAHGLRLGDYITLDDSVGFDDITAAMDTAWDDVGLPRGTGAVDMVVHSTGGLVVRDWMDRNFDVDASPVRNLLMLAPANFGSPLAHKGRTFIGRVATSWKIGAWVETGRQVVTGLELAGAYSTDLALRDRFGAGARYRGDRVRCTVLVGNVGYDGISAAANEEGSDGTVRVSTANMNAALVTADFTGDPHEPEVRKRRSNGATAFAVMDGEHHGSIKNGEPRSDEVWDWMRDALTVTPAGFADHVRRCREHTADVTRAAEEAGETYRHGFQNTVVRVTDQFGAPVDDYFIEFYVRDDDRDWWADFFHRDVIRSVHCFGGDASRRAVLVDVSALHNQADRPGEGMEISLTAHPVWRGEDPDLPKGEVGHPVGYDTLDDDGIGSIRIPWADLGEWFAHHRTVLVEIVLERRRHPAVFRIREHDA